MQDTLLLLWTAAFISSCEVSADPLYATLYTEAPVPPDLSANSPRVCLLGFKGASTSRSLRARLKRQAHAVSAAQAHAHTNNHCPLSSAANNQWRLFADSQRSGGRTDGRAAGGRRCSVPPSLSRPTGRPAGGTGGGRGGPHPRACVRPRRAVGPPSARPSRH